MGMVFFFFFFPFSFLLLATCRDGTMVEEQWWRRQRERNTEREKESDVKRFWV